MSVFIQNPQPGSKFESDSFLLVNSKTSGPIAVVAMELWVDGKLAEVKSAPTSQGVSPFAAHFSWEALQVGPHSLFVRAIDTRGGTSSSALLPFVVVEPGSVSPQELNSAYLPPGPSVPANFEAGGQGPAPENDMPPYQPAQPQVLPPDAPTAAEPWSPTVSGWFNFLFPDSNAPAAPAIPASAVEVCRPRLWISDNSESEDGFYIYRRDPGMANFMKIATLASHVGVIFTFEDDDLYGSYQYYVSAFHQSGEAPSNIETVEVDSSNCEPESEPVINLSITKIFSEVPLDMGYCYTSFDGAHWMRYPANPESFLSPTADGLGLEGTGLLTSLVDAGQAVMLDLECWGWAGGSVEPLGKWHFENVFVDATHLEGIEIKSFGGGPTFGLLSEQDPSNFLIHDLRVPIPQASLGSGPEDCPDHAGPNPLYQVVCMDIADDLDSVVWDLAGCWVDICYNENLVIGYNVYDTHFDQGKTPDQTIDSPISLYFMLNGQSCDPRHVWVTALVEYQGNVLESFPSNMVFYTGNPDCPFLFGLAKRPYRVTFDSIDFSVGDITDDPDVLDDAEGEGYLSVAGWYSGWSLTLGDAGLHEHWIFEDDVPPNPYNFANINLCPVGMPYSITTCVGAHKNNNSREIELYIGEQVTIHAQIYDWDANTNDDPICIPTDYVFDTYAVDNTPNQLLNGMLSASHADGACVVTFHVEFVH